MYVLNLNLGVFLFVIFFSLFALGVKKTIEESKFIVFFKYFIFVNILYPLFEKPKYFLGLFCNIRIIVIIIYFILVARKFNFMHFIVKKNYK